MKSGEMSGDVTSREVRPRFLVKDGRRPKIQAYSALCGTSVHLVRRLEQT